VPLSAAPVTMASNCCPIFPDSSSAGGGLADPALNLGGGVFLIGAVFCEFRQFRMV